MRGGAPAVLTAIAGLLAGGAAVAADLPKSFQGSWHAIGDCSDQNDVPGGYIKIGPRKLEGHAFACEFSGVKEIDDQQNRQVTAHRTCRAGGKETQADVRLYVTTGDLIGETLVTVNQDGSFLTLYRRCPEPKP
jgi:hypothetical protein